MRLQTEAGATEYRPAFGLTSSQIQRIASLPPDQQMMLGQNPTPELLARAAGIPVQQAADVLASMEQTDQATMDSYAQAQEEVKPDYSPRPSDIMPTAKGVNLLTGQTTTTYEPIEGSQELPLWKQMWLDVIRGTATETAKARNILITPEDLQHKSVFADLPGYERVQSFRDLVNLFSDEEAMATIRQYNLGERVLMSKTVLDNAWNMWENSDSATKYVPRALSAALSTVGSVFMLPAQWIERASGTLTNLAKGALAAAGVPSYQGYKGITASEAYQLSRTQYSQAFATAKRMLLMQRDNSESPALTTLNVDQEMSAGGNPQVGF